MPGTGKKTRGDKRMTKTGAAMRIEEPTLSAAGQASAGLGGSSASGAHANGAHTVHPPEASASAQAAPPKTVSQVLGEITWLMTQSPRHKAMPLGDLEWLVMPAILLKQFRFFLQGRAACRCRVLGAGG